MKATKHVLSMLMVLCLLLSLGLSAYAQTVDIGQPEPSGSITVTEPRAGATYDLYKIFDATISDNAQDPDHLHVSYQIPASVAAADRATYLGAGSTWFDVDSNGYVTIKDSVTLDDTVMKSEAFQNWVASYKTKGTKLGSTITSDGTSLTIQHVPYGYYFLDSSLRGESENPTPLVMAVTSKEGAQIIEKNRIPTWDNTPPSPPPTDPPTPPVDPPVNPPTDDPNPDPNPGKVILEKNADGNWRQTKMNEAPLDEDIIFDIGVNATNYDHEKKIYYYMVEDVLPEGMTYTEAPSIAVNAENSDAFVAVAAANIVYFSGAAMTQTTTTLASARAFRVGVPWTSTGTVAGTSLYPSSSVIHVRYKAKLDSTKPTAVNFEAANVNTARFKWYADDPSNPNPPTTPPDISNPGTPTGTSTDKTTETYITKLAVLKTDGTAALGGAEFTLTGPTGSVIYTHGTRYVKDNTNGTYWLLTDGTYTQTAPTAQGIDTSKYAQPTTDKYKLESFDEVQGTGKTETAIKGYVKLDTSKTPNEASVVFEGLAAGDYTLSESVVPAGYNKIDDISFTVSFNKSTKKFSTNKADIALNASNALQTTVVNHAGTELPSTGGMGTTVFYALGSLMIVGAVVLMITRKRMGKEN